MSARRDNRKRHHAVGSKVRVVFGVNEVVATVVEDRGPVGVGGRLLLRVRLDIPGAGEPIELEIPAEDVKAAA